MLGRLFFLLAKDLRILRRSPLLLVLLVLYPVIVALLIGISLSRGPEKPTIAFLNQLPTTRKLDIGGNELDLGLARQELERRVDVVNVTSRAKAEQKVRSGEALGALIIPADTVSKLESTVAQPTVDVIVNEEDPLKRRLVDDTISSVLADANRRVSQALTQTTIDYLNVVLAGGTIQILGRTFNVLGLEGTGREIEQVRKEIPSGSKEARQLDQVLRFNRLARENFNLVNQALESISQPIKVKKTVLKGSAVPLTTFAAAIAVAVSLMFVTVLLASGALALERTDNAFGRLVRGPVTRTHLLAEKAALAVICSLAVVLVMLGALTFFIDVDWARAPLWLGSLIVAALAFACFGLTIGAIARELEAASLLAFTLLIPVAFLALVPTGVVSSFLYDVIRVISALFPFKPTVSAMNAALYESGGLGLPLVHLAVLAGAYGVAARLALRRFG
jgi:ABC-type transport system involved in multi-copper enzyme maturation permease subunit